MDNKPHFIGIFVMLADLAIIIVTFWSLFPSDLQSQENFLNKDLDDVDEFLWVTNESSLNLTCNIAEFLDE